MGLKKYKKLLLMLSVMSAPAIVAEVIDENIANAEYRAGIYYSSGKVANGWVNDGTGTYYFQNGKKYTGYATDSTGKKFFINGKYADGKIGNFTFKNGELVLQNNSGSVSTTPKVTTKNGYVNGLYYRDNQLANWWYYDGTDWYFFQNGKKLTGYGKDNSGQKYFVNGKYANGTYAGKTYKDGVEVKATTKNGYVNGLYYRNNQLANWWYDDGTDWYFFQNGKKLTGYGKDNSGQKYFVNGKYANGTYAGKTYKDGVEVKVTTKKDGYVNGLYYRNNQLANWWYDDGTDWYFFQNGKKLTGYGKDNSGQKYFVNGKYANGTYAGKTYKDGLEVTTTAPSKTTSYIGGKLYKDGKLANGWVNDGSGEYYFQNGLKHTGYATDTTGKKFFINGKYADGKIGSYTFKNGELVLPGSSENTTTKKDGYVNGLYYRNNQLANWWYDDGTDWYFFQNGKKLTGYGKDNSGQKYFVNGKYANGTYAGKTYKNGVEVTTSSPNANYSKVIFIDPGHGGADPGASYYGLREKDLTLSVYDKLYAQLQSQGYTVLTSRNTDKYVDFVTERSRLVNQTNADMFISLHFNASGRGAGSSAQGIETYWYQSYAEYPSKINKDMHNDPERLRKSKLLAESVHSNVVASSGAVNRGVQRNTFAVLRETAKPAILIELGYMDNYAESQKIRQSSYQDKLVDGIVKGINKYYSAL